jgi:NCS2 family nucleobase:cation symporter-2
VREIGGSFDQVRGVVALTMVACGIGTMAQALRLPGFGSGFLCPNLCGPNFFAACMSAAWLGGLPLMRGMTIAAALVEAVFSRTIRQLGFLFPPGDGARGADGGGIPRPARDLEFLGVTFEGEPSPRRPRRRPVTLVTAGRGQRLGARRLPVRRPHQLVTGYVCSVATGFSGTADLARLDRSPWVAVPWIDMTDLAFRWSLLPMFVIVSITGAEVDGQLTMCEKVNDTDWKAQPGAHRQRAPRRLGGADRVRAHQRHGLGYVREQRQPQHRLRGDGPHGFAAGALFVALGFLPRSAVSSR